MIPNNRSVNKLVEGFGMRTKQTKIVKKGVYRVVLNNGRTYSLKKMPGSIDLLRWTDRTLQNVRRNGFSAISWRKPETKAGKKLFFRSKAGGAPYVLTPWIKGRLPNIRSRTDLVACGAALARFHQAANRSGSVAGKARNKLGQWENDLANNHRFLQRMVDKAKQNGFRTHLDHLLQMHGDEILSYAQEARAMLRRSNYRTLCRNSKKNRPVCHGDGGPSNFILNQKGVHLIDFETLRQDLRAYDLYRVIYNTFQYQRKYETAQALLDGYQSVVSLKPADIALTKVWIRFPRTTCLLLRSLRVKKSMVDVIRVFPEAMEKERKVAAVLAGLDRYTVRGARGSR